MFTCQTLERSSTKGRFLYRVMRKSTIATSLLLQFSTFDVANSLWNTKPPTKRLSTSSSSHRWTASHSRCVHVKPIRHVHTAINSFPTETEEQMTNDALSIVREAIDAVDPWNAVRAHLTLSDDGRHIQVGSDNSDKLDINKYDELVLVSFGKASSAMAASVLEQLQGGADSNNQLPIPKTSGVVICKDDHATKEEEEFLSTHGIDIYMASHPVPDERSTKAAKALLDLVENCASPKTLVICCISGGGSALFCKPKHPLNLEDLQAVNSVLLASGMGIQEMNVIRKRLEEGKGGRLAASCHPSQLVTLVLSDVLGDPLDLIASGPTVPDTSTFVDAWDIVDRYNILDLLPESVRVLLQQGKNGEVEDSPSAEHLAFATSKTTLVGNNDIAVEAAAKKASDLGYKPVILGTRIEGEAKEIAHFYTGMATYLQQNEDRLSDFSLSPSLPVALIAGGETTVSLSPDSGLGGRNQELALAAALQLNTLGLRNVVLASVGTDGTDGPTDAAGAVVDATTVSGDDIKPLAQQAMKDHDAYPFLDKLASQRPKKLPPPLIKTGPTGTNVADICVTLVNSSQ